MDVTVERSLYLIGQQECISLTVSVLSMLATSKDQVFVIHASLSKIVILHLLWVATVLTLGREYRSSGLAA